MSRTDTNLLTEEDLDILNGPVFPADPLIDHLLIGERACLNERGARFYACAFAKVGLRVDVNTLGSLRQLNDAVFRGREILYSQGEVAARHELASRQVAPSFREIEHAFLDGTLEDILKAGKRLRAARAAGSNVIPVNFEVNAAKSSRRRESCFP